MNATASFYVFVVSLVLVASSSADIINVPATKKMPSPLRTVIGQDNPSDLIRLELDPMAYTLLKTEHTVSLTDFLLAPLAAGEPPQTVTLELRRIQIFGDRTQFVVSGGGSTHNLEIPDIAIFTGSVTDHPGSSVYLSFSPHGTNGYLHIDGTTQVISSGPHGQGHDLLIYNMNNLPPGAIHWRDFVCDAEIRPQHSTTRNTTSGDNLCYSLLIAVETDFEYTNDIFGGDVDAASAYVATLLGASSEIFARDTDASFELGFVRLWNSPDDPWTGGNTQSQFDQFRNVWIDTMQDIERDLAHFLSGRSLGGGLAWIGGLCSSSYGYGLSAGIDGFFPYPLEDNHPQNHDIRLVSHELGHNVGAFHTHDFCPPIDRCAPYASHGQCQDTTVCINNGTIMSYCQQCTGGDANIVLEFHAANVDLMQSLLESATCDLVCDSDGDGHSDSSDNCPDMPNPGQEDSDGDGVGDVCDSCSGFDDNLDCNSNGVPDGCDIAEGTSEDCTENGIPDECEPDCNGNGLADSCDIAEGTSEDCTENSIPDECEPDCNGNGVADSCDIAEATSEDCTGNGVPDECESDCNGNGVADSCDIAEGTSEDCNTNAAPDACDISGGSSEDCNDNSVPDECDVAEGTSYDCNTNAVPDECDISVGTSEDCSGNGTPDECEEVMPIITGQPSSQEIEAGDFAFFVVGAEGLLLEYQWRKDGENLEDDGRIIGAQASGLIILNVEPADAAVYDCMVTDSFGNCALSNPAILTVTDSCPADLDDDGTVEASDLAQLLGSWGPCDDCYVCPADFNDDCGVNAADLAVLLGAWGPCD